MTYSEALNYINSFLMFGSKPGLERVTEILTLMGDPQKRLRVIHVAGTNGKGSVCTYLTSVLTKCGYKVGTYVSPYISDFRERISVCGEMISEDDLASLIEEVKGYIARMTQQITEFEVITAAAFKYFADQKCDIVILETGMGGRFDATNVVEKPLLSVITSVSYDHMQYLGNTLAEIAFEKCGIIKRGCTTVCYPLQNGEVLNIVQKAVREKENILYIPDVNKLSVYKKTLEFTHISYNELKIDIPLKGDHQIYNCITAVEALYRLREEGYDITDENIVSGIRSTFIPARFEILSRDPLVIIDGAHNEDGVDALCKSLPQFLEGKKLISVMGMLRDKKYEESIGKISAMSQLMITVTPNNPRALSAADAAKVAEKNCTAVAAASLEDAAVLAIKTQREMLDSVILVCGSLYISGEMKKHLNKKL